MDAVKKLQAIVSGFGNYIFKNPEIEELAKVRAEICASCEHADPEHQFKKLLPDKSTEIIHGMGCSICGCLLSAKVRQVIEGCPEDKW